MSQPPRDRTPQRQPAMRTRPAQPRTVRTGPPATRPSARPRSVQPRRDPFPYVMGAVVAAMVIGLAAVVFLLSANNVPAQTTGTTGTPNTAATLLTPANPASGAAQPTQASDLPPRMPLADFKALYDDPAKRPLIIDVRPAETYNAGHIKGAISFPEADVDARIKELPKDKLIVAYCQ